MKLRALFAATTVILTACGGGGGGSGVADERPEGTAKGIAQHGPIVNADISAYDWDGSRGTHRGSTRTDGEGRYSLNLSVPDRPLLIGSREGSYSEESTGRSVQMGNDELTAVIFYESGRSVDVQLTYFTTLATCRAEYLIGEQGLTVGNAINQANNEWSAILGVDIVGVQPVDVTQTSAFTPFMTPSHQYGVALAGVSELVNQIRLEDGADESNTTYTVKYLTKVACEDIRHDGALNGLAAPTAGNPSGQLYVGSTALNVDWYRRALGQGVIAFGSNENNKTGLTASHFLEMANTIALSSSAVFDGQEGSPVDNEGPIITSTLAEGSLVNGTTSLTFEVSDPLGVKTVGFYIDDNFYADAQPGNPVLNWTTTAYSDGEHIVKVVATDVLDNPTEQEFTFTVANTGPGLTFTSPTLVNGTSYTAAGTFSAVMAEVSRIAVNGVDATINQEEGTWTANIELSGGVNDVQAVIYDVLDNSSALDTVVRVDLFAPSISSWDTLAKLTNYDGLLNTCESVFLNAENSDDRPICLNAEKISLDGTPVRNSLHNDGYLTLGMEFSDPQGAYGVFSDNENIRLEYQVWLNGELLVGWADVPRPDPTRSVAVLPVTEEYFGEGFYQVSRDDNFRVLLRVTDEAGGNNDLTYDFNLDVLTPAFNLSQNIVNESLFDKEFSQRTTINGSNLVVEYTYENASSLPYVIQVDPSNNSQVVQAYESAIRKNRARVVTSEEWRYRTRQLLNDELSEWAVTDVFYVYNGGAYTEYRVPDPQYGEFQWYDQEVVNPPQPAGWQSLQDRIPCTVNNSYKQNDYDVGYNLYTTKLNIEGRTVHWSPACFLERVPLAGWWVKENHSQFRQSYYVEYANGYPRNEFSDLNRVWEADSSSVQVINETASVEVFAQNGWYRIPAQANIKIRKIIQLPNITNYDDSRVLVDNSNIPYSTPAYLDKQISWEIDTGLSITRAIDTGDLEDIDTVSQTVSEHGSGISTFTISRP